MGELQEVCSRCGRQMQQMPGMEGSEDGWWSCSPCQLMYVNIVPEFPSEMIQQLAAPRKPDMASMAPEFFGALRRRHYAEVSRILDRVSEPIWEDLGFLDPVLLPETTSTPDRTYDGATVRDVVTRAFEGTPVEASCSLRSFKGKRLQP